MTNAWLFLTAALFGCALTYGVWLMAEKRRIHDIPNDRSMHTTRLAVGAGWAIVGVVGLLLPLTATWPFSKTALVIATMMALAVVSWMDDLRSSPPLLRLVVQIGVIAICLTHLPDEARIFPGLLPRGLERVLAGAAWLWFVNLYNFMDGIDGITGVETIAIASGYAVVSTMPGQSAPMLPLAIILAGAATGFLIWNWHPSRIILGDVGSIPLGFLLGWLMLDLAERGDIAAAIILPLHHLVDATFTLLRRILTVPEPWKPHRQHIYQKAVLRGFSVPSVVIRIGLLDVILIGCAVMSLGRPFTALGVAMAATVAVLLYHAMGATAGATSRSAG